MKSLDTNVLARFFVDDPDDEEATRQRPAAIAAMADPALVTVTVLLELEWVMRGFYGLGRDDIARVLRALLSIEHLTVEDREAAEIALNAFQNGLDFADALHLARSGSATAFATFDRSLAKRASGRSLVPPVELLSPPEG